LFDFGIEGDVGEDPNNMTLWFSQPDLGLPSKVSTLTMDVVSFLKKISSRNITRTNPSEMYIGRSLKV
jgi:endothelin-converting enzyme